MITVRNKIQLSLQTIFRSGLFLLLLTSASCARKGSGSATSQPPVVPQAQPAVSTTIGTGNQSAASPTVIIYKTKKDYSRQVPILLDQSRSRIISYPAPSDLKRGNSLSLPTPLINGYWLDNRGINAQVAFLSYTYEEYSQMTQAPSIAELYDAIIDKEPLLDIRECGRRSDYQDIVTELNRLITENGWK